MKLCYQQEPHIFSVCTKNQVIPLKSVGSNAKNDMVGKSTRRVNQQKESGSATEEGTSAKAEGSSTTEEGKSHLERAAQPTGSVTPHFVSVTQP